MKILAVPALRLAPALRLIPALRSMPAPRRHALAGPLLALAFAALAPLLLVSSAAGIDTATRPVGPVRAWSAEDLERFDDAWLQVKLVEGAGLRLEGGRWIAEECGAPESPEALEATEALPALNALGADPSVVEIRPTFSSQPEILRAWKAAGEARGGGVGPDLSLWHNLRVAGGRPAVARLVNAFNACPAVEIAHPVAHVEPAVLATRAPSLPALPRQTRTPDFTSQQGYLYDPPVGLDAPAAWAIPGGRGEQIRFIDVELCWTEDHEDFAYDRFFYEGGTTQNPSYETHGTAVLGEVIGQPNGFGITGFASAVEYGVVAIDINVYPDVARYFQEALDHLDAGDVWLIELQMFPPGRDATPMEYLQVNYDVIWTSTWGRQVVCVEAGANGAQNLDDPSWGGLFDRNVRDSGAIMVGAGTPTGRVAEYFTNYGSRIDVHAWGSSIVTTGYGDLYDGGTLQTRYTSGFSGTSGASPMVVGASLCLQGIAREHLGYGLPPEQLRAILHDTGVPHLDPTKEIGPRPDLGAASQAVLLLSPSAYLSLESLAVDDDGESPSQGNGNGVPEYAETIELAVTLRNLGQIEALDVTGELLSDDPFVALSSAQASFGTIPGGGSATGSAPFVFTIDAAVPDGHEAAFRLAVSEPPDTLEFALTLGAPALSVIAFALDDAAGGNGNGVAEPGETVALDLTVGNDGSATVSDLWGTLSGGPYLTIDPAPAPFGTVAPGAESTGGPFTIAIAPECPDPISLPLQLALAGAGGYAASDDLALHVGEAFAEDMEGGAASWSHAPASPEFGDQWHLETYRNHTYGGAVSWKCGGEGAADYGSSLYALLESPPFALPEGASLTFWHWIEAEVSGSYPGYCYDGGLLEISIDGGPWEAIIPEGGYPYLTRPGSNPLPEGTPVFSGSHDWSEEAFDLSGRSGSARIRFVFATDGAVSQEGWYIDDVLLQLGFSAAGEPAGVARIELRPASAMPAIGGAALQLVMPREGEIEVALFDAAGRRLRTLAQGPRASGIHFLNWDGRDAGGSSAPAGVYWARLSFAGERSAARIVLVR